MSCFRTGTFAPLDRRRGDTTVAELGACGRARWTILSKRPNRHTTNPLLHTKPDNQKTQDTGYLELLDGGTVIF
jgi:hypothetical protein